MKFDSKETDELRLNNLSQQYACHLIAFAQRIFLRILQLTDYGKPLALSRVLTS